MGHEVFVSRPNVRLDGGTVKKWGEQTLGRGENHKITFYNHYRNNSPERKWGMCVERYGKEDGFGKLKRDIMFTTHYIVTYDRKAENLKGKRLYMNENLCGGECERKSEREKQNVKISRRGSSRGPRLQVPTHGDVPPPLRHPLLP